MNAIEVLKEDHAYVKKAYARFEKMDHEDLEAVQADLLEEAEVEHASAKTLIRQLERMKPRDPKYIATFTVLCEYVEHHVKEEENEMFPKVRRAGLNLAALGKKLLERKARLAR